VHIILIAMCCVLAYCIYLYHYAVQSDQHTGRNLGTPLLGCSETVD
jgi:hypothetical protein